MSGRPPDGHVQGIDGKVYPLPLHKDDREWLIGRVHYLSHDDRLSVRQIQAEILQEHGVRRSVGWISGILSGYKCDACSGVQVFQKPSPEHHLNTSQDGHR